MLIYPAIDIIGGKCVRLTQGNYDRMETYSDDPVEMALGFEKAGAKAIHIIDLDGARLGEPVNLGIASMIAVNVSVPVQLGGGIRTIDDIQIALNKGIHRVILGTAAVRNASLVQEAIGSFGDAIVIAIDAKNGKVAISGWAELSSENAADFAKHMEKLGAGTIIYTDILRDGMLSGPNFKEIKKIASAVKIRVIAAGGITSVNDIKRLRDEGIGGAIIGKALYTGDISLSEALLAAGEQ
jgi:phosphoribosylformimino-5-aminoimidazole carboxamide ribotide isomerase